MKSLAFYRVSTAIQELDRQVADIQAYAAANKYEICKEISVKISGLKQNRKDLTEVISYLNKNTDVKYLLVTELSRIGRTTDIIYFINTLANMGVCVVATKNNIKSLDNEGKIDFMTNFLITMLAGINTFEVDTNKHRMQSGRRHKMTNYSTFGGGAVAYGYKIMDKKLVINDEEAKIVKQMFDFAYNGKSKNYITKWLNDSHIATPGRSEMWQTQTVGKMLKNDLYIGKYSFGDITLNVPPIISQEVFNSVNTKVIKEVKRVNTYLLNSGLVKCGICGQNYYPLTIEKNRTAFYYCASRKQRQYGKNDCGNNVIGINKLNQLVIYSIVYNENNKKLIETELQKNGYAEKMQMLIDENIRLNSGLKNFDKKEKQLLEYALHSNLSIETLNKQKKELDNDKQQIINTIKANELQIKQYEKLRKEQKTLLELFRSKENINLLKHNINNIIQKIVVNKINWQNEKNKNDVMSKVSIYTINEQKFDYLITRQSDTIYQFKSDETSQKRVINALKLLNKDLNEFLTKNMLEAKDLSQYFK